MNPMTNQITKNRRSARVWCNRIAICFAVCLLVAIAVLVGRLPIGGTILISDGQSDRFGEIMKQNGVLLWTGISKFGMMSVPFDNPFALIAVDDDVLADARRRSYRAIIEYRCIVPYFNYSVDTKYQ